MASVAYFSDISLPCRRQNHREGREGTSLPLLIHEAKQQVGRGPDKTVSAVHPYIGSEHGRRCVKTADSGSRPVWLPRCLLLSVIPVGLRAVWRV